MSAQDKQIDDPDAYVKEQSFKKILSSIPSLQAGEKIKKLYRRGGRKSHWIIG